MPGFLLAQHRRLERLRLQAQYRLARLYERGSDDLFPPIPKLAARSYEMAAAQDETNSMYALAKMYVSGTGVPRDSARAAKLFRGGCG